MSKEGEIVENSVPMAMAALRAAIELDDHLAWGWHCNIAVCAQDEGLDWEASQRAARRFMGVAFGRSDYPSEPKYDNTEQPDEVGHIDRRRAESREE